MPENLRVLKGRIRTAKNIAQLAKTLEMVSGLQDPPRARVLRKPCVRTRSASPSLTSHHAALAFRTTSRCTLPPQAERARSGILLAIGPDKGLCGPLTGNLVRKLARQHGREHAAHHGRAGAWRRPAYGSPGSVSSPPSSWARACPSTRSFSSSSASSTSTSCPADCRDARRPVQQVRLLLLPGADAPEVLPLEATVGTLPSTAAPAEFEPGERSAPGRSPAPLPGGAPVRRRGAGLLRGAGGAHGGHAEREGERAGDRGYVHASVQQDPAGADHQRDPRPRQQGEEDMSTTSAHAQRPRGGDGHQGPGPRHRRRVPRRAADYPRGARARQGNGRAPRPGDRVRPGQRGSEDARPGPHGRGPARHEGAAHRRADHCSHRGEDPGADLRRAGQHHRRRSEARRHRGSAVPSTSSRPPSRRRRRGPRCWRRASRSST